ncbi:MAG: family 16 glycosylhydrolase [Pseudomonadota bacterium]|nr:family 16 glycosylhydrolase [Pseudomonadota bacterium]
MKKSLASTLCLGLGLFVACSVHAESDGFYAKFTTLDPAIWYASNGWVNGDYQACEWAADEAFAAEGRLVLQLSEPGGKVRPVSCAEIHTKIPTGYGTYEVRMRPAAGPGLNTAFFTYVGPGTGAPEWDEIDFEFLGKNTHAVQVNYYTNGKGGHEAIVQLPFDASKSMHEYAFDWTETKIRWYVDRKLVHETPDGAVMPKNPGLVYLTLWAGGSQMNGWLGPFHYIDPVTADVEWTRFTPVEAGCPYPHVSKCK